MIQFIMKALGFKNKKEPFLAVIESEITYEIRINDATLKCHSMINLKDLGFKRTIQLRGGISHYCYTLEDIDGFQVRVWADTKIVELGHLGELSGVITEFIHYHMYRNTFLSNNKGDRENALFLYDHNTNHVHLIGHTDIANIPRITDSAMRYQVVDLSANIWREISHFVEDLCYVDSGVRLIQTKGS